MHQGNSVDNTISVVYENTVTIRSVCMPDKGGCLILHFRPFDVRQPCWQVSENFTNGPVGRIVAVSRILINHCISTR